MCRHNFGDDIMHSCQDIEENRCFSNGGTNLHIHTIAQGRPEDNQVEFLQGPHGIVNPLKNLVLNNIRRFTMEHIGAANGLTCVSLLAAIFSHLLTNLPRVLESYRYDGRSKFNSVLHTENDYVSYRFSAICGEFSGLPRSRLPSLSRFIHSSDQLRSCRL